MLSDDFSCSDCHIEYIEKKWNEILINWINRCVSPKNPRIKHLRQRCLVDIINRYKEDICSNDIDRAILCSDDVEPFIKYKFPILRLRHFSENNDSQMKLYAMTSVLLYYCCMNSIKGAVDRDICSEMEEIEQEIILQFCENLSKMETTIYNVQSAIRDAWEQVQKRLKMISINEEHKMSANDDDSIVDIHKNENNIGPRRSPLKFKSSVTVMPSTIVTENSSIPVSSSEAVAEYYEKIFCNEDDRSIMAYEVASVVTRETESKIDCSKTCCNEACKCEKCIPVECTDCGDKNKSANNPSRDKKKTSKITKKMRTVTLVIMLIAICAILAAAIPFAVMKFKKNKDKETEKAKIERRSFNEVSIPKISSGWLCVDGICKKFNSSNQTSHLFPTLSRCSFVCSGIWPHLWPHPIGDVNFSKDVVFISTLKLDYKFISVPSENVNQYLAAAINLFISDLVKLEKPNKQQKYDKNNIEIKKMFIEISVALDPDPRLRVNTDESYTLKINTDLNQVHIKLISESFCGVRHSLETLSQIIVLDETTRQLMTFSKVSIKDAPSFKYRGLMIDTGRNYINLKDLLRTVDAMAMSKFNTFHWRISDVTSFPLMLQASPQLFQHGAYDLSMIYTEDDVKTLVQRAAIRGIRVLLEIALPGPVGRPWSWSSDASCSKQRENKICNELCLKHDMTESFFDLLQDIYTEILNLTMVDDIFHLSDGFFSLANCEFRVEDRVGFLEKALERLKLANKGFLPALPIIWYTSHLESESERNLWEKYGVQFDELSPKLHEQFISKYRAIHSSKWYLSCKMKNNRCKKFRSWQEMYSWKPWGMIQSFTIEGGEAILWTDLVDSGNLDFTIWPRALAVAERLWSDVVANTTVGGNEYIRLDQQRRRMILRGINVNPIWPARCSFNPRECLKKIQKT